MYTLLGINQSNHLLNELLRMIYENRITEMLKMTLFFSLQIFIRKTKINIMSPLYNFKSPFFSSNPFSAKCPVFILNILSHVISL